MALVVSRVPLDTAFYESRLSPQEFASVVDWFAVKRGNYNKALGRGGRLGPLARELKALREQEVNNRVARPPPPPPLSSSPPPPPPLSSSPPPPPSTSAPVLEIVDDVIEIPTPTVVVPSGAGGAAQAATSYIQKVGSAASQFMLMMSSATTDFVNEVAHPTTASTSSGPQCPICFETVTDPYMGRCSHIYCRSCLLDPNMRTETVSEYGGIEALRVRKCPQCRREGISFYRMLS